MIDTVKKFLRDQSLIGAGSLTYNVTIGRSIIFEIFQKPDIYIIVKTSEIVDLKREFNSQKISNAAFPERVPVPLAFGRSNGVFLLASQGVVHARLNAATIGGAGERLDLGIREYATRSAEAFSNPHPTFQHYQNLERGINVLNDEGLANTLATYMRRTEMEQIQKLPHIRQHGDLVVSNIGVTSQGIVIFDWEDFGRVELPGFDVGLLLVSCLEYNVSLIKRWFDLRKPRRLDHAITAAALALGVTRSNLWRLLPVYLTHFLVLKKMFNYEPLIRHLVRRLITDLCNLRM